MSTRRKLLILAALYVLAGSVADWTLARPELDALLAAPPDLWSGPSGLSVLVPVFRMLARAIGLGTLAAVLLKNLLVQPILLWTLWRVRSRSSLPAVSLAVVLFVLTCPPLVRMSLSLMPEEAWLIPLLAFLFWRLAFEPDRSGWPTGLALAALVLAKSSMRLLGPAALVLTLRRRDRRAFAWQALLCLGAFVAVGLINQQITGRFRFGSWQNGYNLYKGNNPLTLQVYPFQTVDRISEPVAAIVDWRDPWAAGDAYTVLTLEFWRDQPAATCRLFMLRAWRMFLAVSDAELGQEGPVILAGKMIGAVYMVFFRAVQLLALGYALWAAAVWARRRRAGADSEAARQGWPAVCFLVFTLCYSAPYLVGFAYERHVLPLIAPTLFYALSVAETRVRIRTGAPPASG